MTKELKVIDGTKERYAPRPHHGLIQAIYDTVEACGGATYADIRKYLPAAINNIGQVLKKNRLKRALYNAVYTGYLIHDDTRKPDYWQIAPIDYYERRQAYVKEIHARSVRGVDKPRGPQLKVVEEYDPADYFIISIRKRYVWFALILGAVMAAFFAGMLL